jgi:hypothetical protein
MTKCAICGNEATLSAPRGWDSSTNSGAYAPECAECAIRDGWIFLNESDMTVLGVPYADWNPPEAEVKKLVDEYKYRSGE